MMYEAAVHKLPRDPLPKLPREYVWAIWEQETGRLVRTGAESKKKKARNRMEEALAELE